LALQWVQHNIAAFGGDHSRVTLLGQSSGGTSIFGLLSAPSSYGLYHNVISLSGSPNITMNLANAERQNEPFVAAVNCAGLGVDATVSCLRALPTYALINISANTLNWYFVPAGYPFPSGPPADFNYPGLIIVDGVTIPKDFLSTLSTTSPDVGMIVQTHLAEAALFVDPSALEFSFGPRSALEQALISQLAPFGSGQNVNNAYSSVLAGHLDNFEILFQMTADADLTCATDVLLEKALAVARRRPLYWSLATQGPQYTFPSLATPGINISSPGHMSDWIAAARDWNFWCNNGPPWTCDWVPGPKDFTVGDQIRAMWINLATYGTLSETSSRGCKAFVAAPSAQNWCLPTSAGVSTVQNYKKAQCDVWNGLGFKEGVWWCD